MYIIKKIRVLFCNNRQDAPTVYEYNRPLSTAEVDTLADTFNAKEHAEITFYFLNEQKRDYWKWVVILPQRDGIPCFLFLDSAQQQGDMLEGEQTNIDSAFRALLLLTANDEAETPKFTDKEMALALLQNCTDRSALRTTPRP